MSAREDGPPPGVAGLALADAHVHLEAAIRPERLIELSARARVPLPSGFGPAGLAWRDLATFVEEYDLLCKLIRSADDYAMVASDYLTHAARAGAVYVDFIVSPAHGWMNGIAYPDLVDALGESIARARAHHGMVASLSLTAVRAPGPLFGPDNALRIVQEAARYPRPWVRGFGIAGDTRFDDLSRYAPAFRLARTSGLVTRAHAGEGEGAAGVLVAMDLLEVDIIDHATCGLVDATVRRRLIDEQRLVTLCPMAHVFVGVVPSLDRHPAWEAMRQGLRVCLGTDDPIFFGVDIAECYGQVAGHLGWEREALTALTRNALSSGLLSDEDAAHASARL